jgi:hypothetical protein
MTEALNVQAHNYYNSLKNHHLTHIQYTTQPSITHFAWLSGTQHDIYIPYYMNSFSVNNFHICIYIFFYLKQH